MTTASLRQAQDLARMMWHKFYVDEVPDFKLSDDLQGVLLQIDNMLTGLVRGPVPMETDMPVGILKREPGNSSITFHANERTLRLGYGDYWLYAARKTR